MTPASEARLSRSIEAREERRYIPYLDSLGNLTVGVGHLVVLGGSIPLTDAAVDAILNGDISAKIRECERRLPFWADLNDARQAACVEAAFNGSLFASPKALAAMGRQDYMTAAAELLDGPWVSQVGDRARALALQIETGEWA